MSVQSKISAVMKDLSEEGVSKDDYNTHGKYKFRGIDAVYNALSPVLAKHQLVIIPSVLETKHQSMTTSTGKPTNHWLVKVNYTIIDAEEETEEKTSRTTTFVGESYDSSDKGLNKALTAAYKYLCFELFCIPVEGTPDSDEENIEVGEPLVPLTDEQRQELLGLCMQGNVRVEGFVTWLGYNELGEVPESEFNRAKEALNAKLAKLAEQSKGESNEQGT